MKDDLTLREEWLRYYAYAMTAPPLLIPKAIEDFWIAKLEQKKKSLIEKIEGLLNKEIAEFERDAYGGEMYRGYNQALSDVIEIIKTK